MGKIFEAKQKFERKAEQAIVEEVIKQLEAAIELKKQGKDADGDKVVDNIKVWLERKIQEIEEQSQPEEQQEIDGFIFPHEGEIVAEGNKVILGVIKKEEKEKYLAVSYQHSFMKGAYKKKAFREATWEEFMSENSFVCSIYEKISGEYVGYCSIKNFVKEDWELAIEIKSDECRKGYGTEALSVLMDAVHKLTGKRFFRARVEIDNYASQGLMKKLGANPNGVSAFLLHGEEIERFQEEHKNMITEEIRNVAAEFCMEAEEILGYVLEYRFDMLNKAMYEIEEEVADEG